MTDTVLDDSGEQIPGRRTLEGTDLEIAYTLLGEDLVLRVNKAGVQVFGVVLEDAAKAMSAQQMLELKSESADHLPYLWGPRVRRRVGKDYASGSGHIVERVCLGN